MEKFEFLIYTLFACFFLLVFSVIFSEIFTAWYETNIHEKNCTNYTDYLLCENSIKY